MKKFAVVTAAPARTKLRLAHEARRGTRESKKVKTMKNTFTLSYETLQRLIAAVDNYKNGLRDELLELEEQPQSQQGQSDSSRTRNEIDYLEQLCKQAFQEGARGE